VRQLDRQVASFLRSSTGWGKLAATDPIASIISAGQRQRRRRGAGQNPIGSLPGARNPLQPRLDCYSRGRLPRLRRRSALAGGRATRCSSRSSDLRITPTLHGRLIAELSAACGLLLLDLVQTLDGRLLGVFFFSFSLFLRPGEPPYYTRDYQRARVCAAMSMRTLRFPAARLHHDQRRARAQGVVGKYYRWLPLRERS